MGGFGVKYSALSVMIWEAERGLCLHRLQRLTRQTQHGSAVNVVLWQVLITVSAIRRSISVRFL